MKHCSFILFGPSFLSSFVPALWVDYPFFEQVVSVHQGEGAKARRSVVCVRANYYASLLSFPLRSLNLRRHDDAFSLLHLLSAVDINHCKVTVPSFLLAVPRIPPPGLLLQAGVGCSDIWFLCKILGNSCTPIKARWSPGLAE